MATTAPTPTNPAKRLDAVRVEDETSIGRSYAKKVTKEVGIGAARRKLTTKSFLASWGEDGEQVHSATLAKTHLHTATKADVLEYFHNTWNLTDVLFSALVNDSVFYSIPDRLRRPLMFYFAHPAAVYINKMALAGLVDNIDLYYQKLFETGVDEMSWDDMDELQDEDFPWPTVEEAQAFRLKCKAVVVKAIEAMPAPNETPVTMESPYWALFMGFEHERIHIETSSVLIHQLPVSSVSKPPAWKYAPVKATSPDAAPANQLLAVEAGTTVLGKPTDFPSFGFDNEYGKRVVDVPAFKASKFLVTNAEFLPFVAANGYREKKYWVSPAGDDEGWRWVSFRNATHPSFWVATADMPDFCGGKPDYPYQKDDGNPETAGKGSAFRLRVMFDVIDMPWDWPVEVNYHEARAFLNWKAEGDGKKYRLPTEAEHTMIRAAPCPFPESKFYVPAAKAGPDVHATYDFMMAGGEAAASNTNFKYGSSSPVDMLPPTPAGFHDVSGNVWEWVEDHFAPLPDFKIHYLYDDFSTPCFDGWHTMMMGGSWVSTGDQSSVFARYAFRRHFFQHLGFRYVQLDPCDAPEPYPGAPTVKNLWEGAGSLSTDITNAYGSRTDRFPYPDAFGDVTGALAYADALAARAVSALEDSGSAVAPHNATVLHLGCGVGGVSFALSKHFKSVVGVDRDEVSVRHARVFQHHGQFEYERVSEGILTDTSLVKVDPSAKRGVVSFFLADVTALPAEVTAMGPFDLVVCDGLLSRLTQPLDLMKALPGLVKTGGALVVSDANDWDPKYTPRNSWFGGFQMNGENMTTMFMLQHGLKKSFVFVGEKDLVKVTRKHSRKYDLSIMQTSAWTRRAAGGGAGAGAGGASGGDDAAAAAAAAAAVSNGAGSGDGCACTSP